MAKKKEEKIIREETIDLSFYAVKSTDGKWFRSKGYMGSGNSWVDDIRKAKIYANPGPAKAQITFWATNYPKYGVPELVKITMGKAYYIDNSANLTDGIRKKAMKEANYTIRQLTWKINNFIERTSSMYSSDKQNVEKWKRELENAKQTLNDLKK